MGHVPVNVTVGDTLNFEGERHIVRRAVVNGVGNTPYLELVPEPLVPGIYEFRGGDFPDNSRNDRAWLVVSKSGQKNYLSLSQEAFTTMSSPVGAWELSDETVREKWVLVRAWG